MCGCVEGWEVCGCVEAVRRGMGNVNLGCSLHLCKKITYHKTRDRSRAPCQGKVHGAVPTATNNKAK